jgi:lysozyme family protein
MCDPYVKHRAALAEILGRLLSADGWPRMRERPAHRGGLAKGDITLDTLGAWRGTPVTVDDLTGLTEDEARQIYAYRYIIQPGYCLSAWNTNAYQVMMTCDELGRGRDHADPERCASGRLQAL